MTHDKEPRRTGRLLIAAVVHGFISGTARAAATWLLSKWA